MSVRSGMRLVRLLALAPAWMALAGCGDPRPVTMPLQERGTVGMFARVVRQDSALKDLTADEKTCIVVTRVEAGGPAERAGVQAGDILLAIEGRRVRRAAEAIYAVQSARPGTSLHLKLKRGRQPFDAVAVVEKLQLPPIAYRKPQEAPDVKEEPPATEKKDGGAKTEGLPDESK